MSCHVGRGVALRSLLDAAVAGTGLALAVWTVAYALDGDQALRHLVLFRYPLADVLVSALAVHLALRLGKPVPVWWWISGTLALLLVLDTAQALVSSFRGAHTLVITSGYLLTYGALALAATHPSIVRLSTVSTGALERDRPLLRSTLMSVATVPAIVAIALPTFGPTDRMVRVPLLALLLALLSARLLVTATDLARLRAIAVHRATHDDLTGLPNRAALLHELERALTSRGVGSSVAVLRIACDDLRHVNDTWGRPAGDALVVEAARRFGLLLPAAATLARTSGDEFVLVAGVDEPAQAAHLARRVVQAGRVPFPVTAHDRHRSSFSVGVALADPGDRVSAVTLLGQTDVALSEARTRWHGHVVTFDPAMEERAITRSRMGIALRAAIARDAFSLAFQPIYGGRDYEDLVGWEALVRWTDDAVGTVPPDVFVPLAEELGLIDDVGRLVMRRACRELAALRRAMARDDLTISVNVAAPQLIRPDFAAFVLRSLASAGLPGEALWLEITETMLVDRGPDAMQALETVRRAGVRVAIDDFGTGYAGLETLGRLPVDGVKIDRSFVDHLADGTGQARRLRHLFDLLRSFDVTRLVAEGVETREQEAELKALGCPLVQGWLYGRPTAPEVILDSVARDPAR